MESSRIPALLTLIVAVLLSGPSRADTIYYTPESGKPPRKGVRIKDITADKIKYTPPGTDREREDSSFDVLFVEYDDSPDSFDRGKAHLAKGNHLDAAEAFRQAVALARAPVPEGEQPLVRSWWLLPAASYYLGEALRLRGEKFPDAYAQALEAYRVVLDEAESSFYTGPALIGQARVHAALGEVDQAEPLFQKVMDLADSRRIAPWHRPPAVEGRAYMYLATGDYSRAASDLERLARDRDDTDPAAAARFRVDAGFAALRGGNRSRAKGLFEELAGSSLPIAAAGGTSGLGFLALEDDNPKKAREAFARVMALHGSAAREYERALSGMIQVMERLDGKEEDASKMADQYRAELKWRGGSEEFLVGGK